MCCEPIDDEHTKDRINGECPACGEPTIDGEAAYGCYYSPVACETCGWQPCNDSC